MNHHKMAFKNESALTKELVYQLSSFKIALSDLFRESSLFCKRSKTLSCLTHDSHSESSESGNCTSSKIELRAINM